MYDGKQKAKRLKRGRRSNNKTGTLLLSFLLIAFVAIGGTLAYLFTKTNPVDNKFNPSSVSCKVTEDFDGQTKSNVNVTNTGDTDAYIRVKLVSYRVNSQGQHIGGIAVIPNFTPGADWVEYGGYYYYKLPVAPGDKPATDLINSITLKDSYPDADGGKQAIDVMAEAIQSGPPEAVGSSWGVSISPGDVTAYQG
jgi:hypothetical protein